MQENEYKDINAIEPDDLGTADPTEIVDVPVSEVPNEGSAEEIIEVVEVIEGEPYDIEISEAFPATGSTNSWDYALMDHRAKNNEHHIGGVTGLQDYLNKIIAIKFGQTGDEVAVYSEQTGVANYYKWHTNAYDEVGYFVSIVLGTSDIEICNGTDIFGVTINRAGFVGGQDATIPRDNSYALVATCGLVEVRCETDVIQGDYVVSNAYGIAQKTNSECGYKVIEKDEDSDRAIIALGVQACVTNKLGKRLQTLGGRLDDVEINIAASMNVANEAYRKAEESMVANEVMGDQISDALVKVDNMAADVDSAVAQAESTAVISAQAKAIAEGAVTSAETLKNEAMAEANKALVESAELRKEFEEKTAEIDAELDNTVQELEATKEGFDTTINDLRLDTEGQLADFKKEVEDNYATATQLAAVKTENSDAVAALKQEVSDTYATIESVASLKTETSDALTGFKQEVSETYATQEMLTSLETETSKALTDYKQEVTDTYATQEMVSTFEQGAAKALADYKQEVSDTYATQEMVTTLETDTSKALSDYKQEVSENYATNTSLATLRSDTTKAIAASEETAAKTYASKSDLTSFENSTNASMALIKQRADANGASIQLLVTDIDKYSVGPYSQAYGFTLEQAKAVLEKGMVYVPTAHSDADTHSESYEGASSPYNFTPGYIYTWTDAGWQESVGKVVEFSNAPSGNAYDFWYANSDEVEEDYEPYTLYKRETYTDESGTLTRWVAVATLNGNSNSKAVSQIRQDTNSIVTEVVDAYGGVAGFGAKLKETEATVNSYAYWPKDDDSWYNLATIDQSADQDGSSLALAVVDKQGETILNGATIVLNQGGNDSFININADRIVLDGETVFTNDDNGETKIDGSYIKTGSITSDQIKAKSITTDELNITTLSAISTNLGTIEAGYIGTGGWIINGDYFYSTKKSLYFFGAEDGKGTYPINGVDTTVNNLVMRTKLSTNSTLGIGADGKLYCTDAYVSGEINATSGKIGGGARQWTIGSSGDQASLYYGNNNISGDYGFGGNADNMYFGTNGCSFTSNMTSDGGFVGYTTVMRSGVITLYGNDTEVSDAINATTTATRLSHSGVAFYYIGEVPHDYNNPNNMYMKGYLGIDCVPEAANTPEVQKFVLHGATLQACDFQQSILPEASEAYDLGSESHLWNNIYAATSTINTSDENRKNSIAPISDQYSLFFDKLTPVMFKLNNGTSDRYHIGFGAQSVEKALLESGLTTQDFAGICIANTEDGETYGLRYGEFVALNTHEIQKLKMEVESLKQQINKILVVEDSSNEES